MASHVIQVAADYYQFYVWDAGTKPKAPTDFSDTDVRRMVKVTNYVVVIQPVRNTMVDVELEVFGTDPGFDASAFDHIVECSVDLPTGRLQVHECLGGPKLDLKVAGGTFRVRTLFAGLATVSPDGTKGRDKYFLAFWPGPATSLHVVKQWCEVG